MIAAFPIALAYVAALHHFTGDVPRYGLATIGVATAGMAARWLYLSLRSFSQE